MASEGAQAQLAMDSAGTAIGSFSEPYDFLSENLKASQERIHSNSIRGTRSRPKERNRQGLRRVSGTITMNPSPTELDNLLPRILGAAEATDTFDVAETLPEFDVLIDRVSKRFNYTSCKVARATFSGSSGQPIQLVLDIVGKDFDNSDTAFPGLTFDTDAMYVFNDSSSGVTLEGSTREIQDFNLVIDNLVEARFRNSNTATDVTAQDRDITLSVTSPFTSSEIALFDDAVDDVDGATGSLVFTNGNQSLTFTFGNLLLMPAETPNVQGKQEIVLPQTYKAYKSGSTADLVVTHDASA